MNSTEPERAKWLVELARALDEAQNLIWRLGNSEVSGVDMLDLMARIEAARAETRFLQLMRLTDPPPPSGPEWIYSPWDGPQPEHCA